MEKQRKTFLSYSRFNRDFAIRLAKELKAEGFDIWLDQLDIPAGARWDREVERALKESEIFMIILTPSSVDSENVLDEIGYAIDNRKRFLPVLLENCEVPLRLRRFQYVDFTNKSFDDGVNSAKDLLRDLIAQTTIPRGVAATEKQAEGEARADAGRKSKEDMDRLAAQKAEEERVAKAQTDREAKAEAERKAKKEAERLAKQKAEEERIAKADREAKAETERLAKQKAEAERLAKAEAERKAREEAERLAAQKAEAERKARERATPVEATPLAMKAESGSFAPSQKKPIPMGVVIGGVAGVVLLIVAAIGIRALSDRGTPATEAPVFETPAATEAPATEAPVVTEASVAEPISITLWYRYDSGSAEESALNILLGQAAADLPGIEITAVQVPIDGFFDKYRAEVSAGGGPDIIFYSQGLITSFARDGLIVDITDLAAGRLDGYSQLGIDGMSLDGRLYGIPESLGGVAFWYNTEMLSTPPATTDALAELIYAGLPIGLGYDCYSSYGFYGAFGGNIFDSNWTVIADQTPVGDALYYLTQLLNTSKGYYDISAYSNFDNSRFINGDFAAVVNGPWAMSAYRDALGDVLGVAPLPAGPAGPATPFVEANGFFINPNSANQNVAVELALYLTSLASQEVMMNEAGHVPARTDIAIRDPLIQGFLDSYNTGATTTLQWPELEKYWTNFCPIDPVLDGSIDPYQWVNEVTAASNR